MGLGAAGAKGENFNTYVSLTGVETFQRGSRIISGCFKGMTGEADAAQTAFKRVGISGGEMMMAGMMVSGAGAGLLAYMHKATEAAATQTGAERRLRTALTASGKGGAIAAQNVDRYAKSLEDTTAVGDEQLINAAAVLASFHMGSKGIKEYLPRMLDMQEGLKKLGGEEMSLEQIAIMLGKGHMGMITALRRVGVMVDVNRYKQIGYKAILEELDKEYKGQSTEAAKGYGGTIKQLDVEINSLNESMGVGMLPILTSTNKVLKPLVKSFTTLNEHTHGVAGEILLGAGALMTFGGGILLLMPGLKALRDMWIEIAAAAGSAAAAEKAAVIAGASSEAATAAKAAGAGAAAAKGANWLSRSGAWIKGGATAGGAAAVRYGKAGLDLGKGAIETMGTAMEGGGAVGVLSSLGLLLTAITGAHVLDWTLGTVTGQGGKRLGNGGWLPNFSPVRALSEAWGIGSDKDRASASKKAAGAAAKRAEDYVQTNDHSLKYLPGEKPPPPSAGTRLPGTTAGISPKSRTNELLEQLVQLGKDQKSILIGGGKRMQGRYNQGDLMRALYGAMGTGVIG
jgi:hypothetical protein